MGVAAAIDCLRGIDRDTVDAVLFASTSYPFKEKQGAAIVAKALDLRRDVYTADLGDSLRAGTNALRAGGRHGEGRLGKRVLVVASDDRMAAPRTGLEAQPGRRRGRVSRRRRATSSRWTPCTAVSDEIIDVWRTEGDPFVHAVGGSLRRRPRLSARTCARSVTGPARRRPAQARRRRHGSCSTVPTRGRTRTVVARARLRPEDAGAAIRSSARSATPAPRWRRCCSPRRWRRRRPGSGSCVVGVRRRRRRAPARRRRRRSSASRAGAASRGTSRGAPSCGATTCISASASSSPPSTTVAPAPASRRPSTSATATTTSRCIAQRCRRCGQAQFPRQRVCFTVLRARTTSTRSGCPTASARSARSRSTTSPAARTPPLVAGIVDVEGARLYLQMTDVEPKEVKLGMPVELTFRKIHEAGGTPNYFWKSTPVR